MKVLPKIIGSGSVVIAFFTGCLAVKVGRVGDFYRIYVSWHAQDIQVDNTNSTLFLETALKSVP